jgi:hypothetical protein
VLRTPRTARLLAVNRYFAGSPGQPRVRRASDAVAIGGGLLLLLWTGLSAGKILAFEQLVVDLAGSLPSWSKNVYQIGYLLGFLMVVSLFVAVILQGKQRLDLLRDLVLAAVVSITVAVLLALWLSEAFPSLPPELSGDDPEAAFPIVRVALITASIMVAAPHLSRPGCSRTSARSLTSRSRPWWIGPRPAPTLATILKSANCRE